MRAHATVTACRSRSGSVRPRLVDLRSAVPLTLRWSGDSLVVVGSAFAPLGGDELELDVVVEPGASLTVRTVAASIAQPNPSGESSSFTVRAVVREDATLRWLPEPGVATRGAVHHNLSLVAVSPGATVVWREEVVLGRHGEPGGEWRSRMHLTCDGAVTLVQDTAIGGPDWPSPAVGAGLRAAGSLLLVGPDAPTTAEVRRDGPASAAVLPLAHPGATLVSALAPDATTLRQLLQPNLPD